MGHFVTRQISGGLGAGARGRSIEKVAALCGSIGDVLTGAGMNESSGAVAKTVRLCPRGLELGDRTVPLVSGSIHYFRLSPRDFQATLVAQKSLGIRIVDVYVPWGVHEEPGGAFDFGARDPRLDVRGFLELAWQEGMLAIVRPGPHINAELTFFGIPERVIWDAECQARSPGNQPVILPVPPLAFPVPSYASERFLDEACVWLEAVAKELAPLVWPNGPIVMCQVDNEGSLFFRDGVYDQDYHPDAIAGYRRFLLEKYQSAAGIRDALADPEADPATLLPPPRLSGVTAFDLARHLDWAEAQEELLARALSRMRAALERGGLTGIPMSHNLPMAEESTPLDPARIGGAVDMIGLDYYYRASEATRAEVARRTGALAARAAEQGYTPFASELGAGFPPFFPPLSEADSAFTALAALAYGLRGFNLYMSVERDRWIGAPIDRRGQRRSFADFWTALTAALERTHFEGLSRDISVYIVIPRSFVRLVRTLHAFGPFSLAAFQIAGGGAEQACFEDDFGMESPLVMETERFVRSLERALDAMRIPFAVVPGDLTEYALAHGEWTIVASTGALEGAIAERVVAAAEAGKAVSIGPHRPTRDGTFRHLPAPLSLKSFASIPSELGLDELEIRAAIGSARAALPLRALDAQPDAIFVTLHRDAAGIPRVAFVLNPSDRELTAELAVPRVVGVTDALDGAEFRATVSRLELPIRARSVRMLELHY